MSAPGSRRGVAAYSLFLAMALAFVVFRVLPVRTVAVDATAAAIIALRIVLAVGLFVGSARIRALAFGVVAFTFVAGLVATTALAVSVSSVAGLYDSVGKGSALVFALGALLVVPYLVVFPALELRALAADRG